MTWIWQIIHLLTLVRKDKVVITLKAFVVFDFNYAILILTNSIITIEPITEDKYNFQNFISSKTELKNVLNDFIIISL